MLACALICSRIRVGDFLSRAASFEICTEEGFRHYRPKGKYLKSCSPYPRTWYFLFICYILKEVFLSCNIELLSHFSVRLVCFVTSCIALPKSTHAYCRTVLCFFPSVYLIYGCFTKEKVRKIIKLLGILKEVKSKFHNNSLLDSLKTGKRVMMLLSCVTSGAICIAVPLTCSSNTS